MSVTKVFISGDVNELESEREIALRSIKSLYLEPTVNNAIVTKEDIMNLSGYDEIRESDLFVLLLWKRLSPDVEKEYQIALESRKSLIICVKMLKGSETRDDSLIRFLQSVREENLSDSAGSKIQAYQDFRSLAELDQILVDAITKEIHRQLKHSVITAGTRQEMYILGARIASAARQRLYIVQKSAILLLGARDYNVPDSQKVWYEMEYLNALNNWITATINDTSRRFVYLYDAEGTKQEIEKYGIHDAVKENVKRYKGFEQKSSYRFQISSISAKSPPGPMTAGDDWYAFWVMGAHDAVTISFTHNLVCNEVIKVLNPLINSESTLESQLAELNLA